MFKFDFPRGPFSRRRSTGPPGPSSIRGLTGSDSPEPIDFLTRLVEEYGDVVRYHNSIGAVYFFNHPDHVKQILRDTNFTKQGVLKLALGSGLLTSEGERWKRQRRIIHPYLTRAKVDAAAPLIIEHTQRMLKGWELALQEAEDLDVAGEFTKLALGVIVSALFSIEVRTHADEIETLRRSTKVIVEHLGAMANMAFSEAHSISHSRQAEFNKSLKELNDTIFRLIAERREMSSKPDDLLSALMDSNDVETFPTDKEVRDEIVTMLLAGHETTAVSLSWTAYLLVRNPQAQTRARQQVNRVLGDRGIDLEDIGKLALVSGAVNEAMRLYPPVWFIPRTSTAAGSVGQYEIKPNSTVMVSPYTTHRHPEFWTDRHEFDPERNHVKNPAYFPFSIGPHSCVGRYFSLQESAIVLAMVLREFNLVSIEQPKVEWEPLITLRVKDGLRVKIARCSPE